MTCQRIHPMQRFMLGFAMIVLLLVGAGQAEAGFIQVSSLAELRANDSLDWGQLGAAVSDPGNPVMAISGNGSIMGVRVVASQPGGSFQRRDEGYGWTGHFSLGDHLLFTNFGPGPITLVFSRPIQGIGFQSGSNAGGPFTTTLDVFNSSDNLLSRSAKIIAQSVREPEVTRMDARCNQGFQIGQG